jgi:hypothetical protein
VVWKQRVFDSLDDFFAPDAIVYESGVSFPDRGLKGCLLSSNMRKAKDERAL